MEKNKIKNIAIVTLYGEINIGNKLQNYAFQEILKEYAINVTTLTYSRKPIVGWKGNVVSRLGFPRRISNIINAKKIRFNRFRMFSNEYLITEPERRFCEFGDEVNNRYDFFISGSDQVWHNFTNTKEEIQYFMLSFVDKNKRVCYAPSFGFDTIPIKFESEYIKGFQGFKYLSCRESIGCELVREKTHRDVELMPDPTMCLSANRWLEIERKPSYDIPHKYILVYFLGNKDSNTKTRLRKLKDETKLPIIDILDDESLEYYTTRPDEFIYLISKAEYVCTNSFHCVVFSIIFHRKVFMYKRIDKTGSGMGSRFSTLLEEFKLKPDENGMLKDFEHVDEIFLLKRKLMRDYLDKALCLNETKR